MPQNPPRFFAPRYFAPVYWGGEVAEGSISASLLGSSAMSAVLTGVQSAYTGGSFYFRNRRFRVALTQPKPAYIRANIAGSGGLAGKVRAAASIGAEISAAGRVGVGLSALAHAASAIGGQAVFDARGLTIDRWAAARAEEELWLIAA